MLKHVAMKIKVGYDYKEQSVNENLVGFIFHDWLCNNCSALIDEKNREFTVSEEEYVWLIFAYPATSLSKFVTIDFDSYKKVYQDGN